MTITSVQKFSFDESSEGRKTESLSFSQTTYSEKPLIPMPTLSDKVIDTITSGASPLPLEISTKKDEILDIHPEYLSMVAAGKKSVEGRLKRPKLDGLEVGKTLLLRNTASLASLLPVKISFLHFYSSFKEMLEHEGIENCLPGIKNIEEGVQLYHSFPGYKEGEVLYGVLGIGISLISSISS